MDAVAAPLTLGFVLGLRHALDADHLVAVSTMASRSRSVFRSSLVGAFWGAGHSATLLLASVAVLLLGRTIPQSWAKGLEAVVGAMIVVLGVDLLRRVLEKQVVVHDHQHDGHSHTHVHLDARRAHEESPHHHAGWRAFVVGSVHGLAGSAALTLFVLSTIRSFGQGLLYVVVFGVGTMIGMAAMSTLMGLPFALAARRATGFARGIQLAAAIGSIAFGGWYLWSAVA